MQFWVYLLRCRDGSYYTGHTDDLEKRLWEHEQGLGAEWTRRRRPVELAWCADAPTRDEAFAFERRVKTWSRAKKEALIANDWALVGHFARPPHERPSTTLGTSEVGDRPRPISLGTGKSDDAQTGSLVLSGARSAKAPLSEVEGSKGAGTEPETGP